MKKIKKIKSQICNLYKTAKKISTDNWDFILISIDLIYSKLRFHITINEYLTYQFYNLKDRYRKNFLLKSYRKKGSNIATRDFTRSKFIFYKRIPDLYTREIILIPHCGEEQFIEFIKNHKHVIIKPDMGSLGRGVFDVKYKDEESAKKLFAKFSTTSPMVCEEFIHQHDLLQELNPFSVNTVRIVSILSGDDIEIVSAVLKIGSMENSVIDNMYAGGIGAQVDVSTGIISTFGVDYHFNTYAHHPITGTQIIGFQLPNWKEAINIAKKAHKRLPQCLIYGWDIAITQNGVDIVEANNSPDPLLIQTMDRIPKGHKIKIMLKKNLLKQPRKRKAPYTPDYATALKSNASIELDVSTMKSEK